MSSLNTMLTLAVCDLNRRSGDGSVTVKARTDGAWRVLHVARGALVATESSVAGERLGNMLAAEGRIDPVLIEPVANEARKRGTLLGHQLIADGLMSPTDLASALERQTRLRFENALSTPGTVGIVARGTIEPVVRVPIGAAVAMAFRSRIDLRSIQDLVTERPRQPVALDLQGELFSRLELGPSELRICRTLASGKTLEELMASTPSPDVVIRLIGVLVALGLWA